MFGVPKYTVNTCSGPQCSAWKSIVWSPRATRRASGCMPACPKSSQDARTYPGSSPQTCGPSRPSYGSGLVAGVRTTSGLSPRGAVVDCGWSPRRWWHCPAGRLGGSRWATHEGLSPPCTCRLMWVSGSAGESSRVDPLAEHTGSRGFRRRCATHKIN
jgi:hypothetical protein